MKKLMIFFACLLMLTACDLEKEVDIDGAEYKESICIFGNISREYGANVSVNKTRNMNDPYGRNTSTIIPDVKVYLTSNGEKIARIPPFKGLQVTGHLDEFHMRIDTFDYDRFGVLVESETMGTAYSTEQILPPVEKPDSVTFKIDDGKCKVVCYFNSQPTTAGYYLAVAQHESAGELFDTLYNITFTESIFQSFKRDIDKKKGYIEDYFYHSVGWGEKYVTCCTDFITLSPDMVKYLESLTNYDNSVEDEFFDFVYPVYNNITGGYGIFGSYSAYHMIDTVPVP